MLVGVHDGVDPVAKAELVEYPTEMGLDRGLGHIELGGNLAVGEAQRYLDEDLPLPFCQARQRIGVD